MTPERLAEIKDTALPSSHILGPMALELIAEIERLQADNERLTFVYLADAKISGALVADNERLRAELAERERQIEALGKRG